MTSTSVPIYNVANKTFETVPIESLTTSTTVSKTKVKTKQKLKNEKKQNIIQAETIPGHRGAMEIDDLVKYINESPIETKKKSKN